MRFQHPREEGVELIQYERFLALRSGLNIFVNLRSVSKKDFKRLIESFCTN